MHRFYDNMKGLICMFLVVLWVIIQKRKTAMKQDEIWLKRIQRSSVWLLIIQLLPTWAAELEQNNFANVGFFPSRKWYFIFVFCCLMNPSPTSVGKIFLAFAIKLLISLFRFFYVIIQNWNFPVCGWIFLSLKKIVSYMSLRIFLV